MCEYFSCVADRKFKVYWSKGSPSHENIISENKLDYSKLEDRDIVRIEITPKDYSKLSREKKDWTFKVDEQKTLPAWFKKNEMKATNVCWKAWSESVKVNIALGHEKHILRGQFMIAGGNSTVKAGGNSTVEAWDNSTVKAGGNSIIIEEHYFSGKISLTSKAQKIKRK